MYVVQLSRATYKNLSIESGSLVFLLLKKYIGSHYVKSYRTQSNHSFQHIMVFSEARHPVLALYLAGQYASSTSSREFAGNSSSRALIQIF